MHRKFIALIVSTAIAITGLSASKARAADAGDILGGLAAIAIIGAAVNHYNKKQERRDKQAVTRHAPQTHYTPPARYRSQRHIQPHKPRPLPKHVARYDLPQRCLRHYDGYTGNHPLLGQKCLSRHYKHAKSLPRSCKVGFWNGKHVRHAYEPRCLRQQGYRVVYN